MWRLQPSRHGFVLWYSAPHACGSLHPCSQVRRCNWRVIRSVFVAGSNLFHFSPMVSPWRVPIARASTNRTPFRRASAALISRRIRPVHRPALRFRRALLERCTQLVLFAAWTGAVLGTDHLGTRGSRTRLRRRSGPVRQPSVNPSARPAKVRSLHSPHPGQTAPDQRKRRSSREAASTSGSCRPGRARCRSALPAAMSRRLCTRRPAGAGGGRPKGYRPSAAGTRTS